MNPNFGFRFLTWEQCCWAALSLDVAALTLALVSRLVSGRLGWLALPIWLVTIPSARHCSVVLLPHPPRLPDTWTLWTLFVAPVVAFASCVAAYKNGRSWLEDTLVGTILAGLSQSMCCAMLEAMSI